MLAETQTVKKKFPLWAYHWRHPPNPVREVWRGLVGRCEARKRIALEVSPVALVVKNPSANAGDIRDAALIPGWEDALEEGMATHSSILAWKIP